MYRHSQTENGLTTVTTFEAYYPELPYRIASWFLDLFQKVPLPDIFQTKAKSFLEKRLQSGDSRTSGAALVIRRSTAPGLPSGLLAKWVSVSGGLRTSKYRTELKLVLEKSRQEI